MFKIVSKPLLNDFEYLEFPKIFTQILNRRPLKNKNELNHELEDLERPHLLTDIEKASERIVEAILQQQSILIVGDFDVDGASSITLFIRVLRRLGHQNLDYLVPNRFEDGYGLTPELLNRLENIPNLIITVDNGIASIEGVAHAHSLGIEVIITDHHLPQETLPKAFAIVNPNRKDDLFPCKSLAGVGVAFYVLSMVRKKLRARNFQNDVKLSHYLDLVALGTIADVVGLDYNNRILVTHGLNRIRKKQTCAGILALCEISKRDPELLTTGDIGFAIAPKLNAAGRLDDMRIGIECLLSDDLNHARHLAQQLESLNQERRDIEQSMLKDAEKILTQLHLDEKALPLGLCLFSEDFHQGVIGIVASRLKERFSRPTIVFAPDKDGFIKGSGRSILDVHMKDLLEGIDLRHPGMIEKFGGHAMAAGLTLLEKNFPAFKQAFNEALSTMLSQDQIGNVLLTDGCLEDEDFALETVEHLKYRFPWGASFPEPVFEAVFTVLDVKILKEAHIKFRLQTEKGLILDAIGFFQARYWSGPQGQPMDDIKIHCAFKLDINHWQGNKNLQLLINGFNMA